MIRRSSYALFMLMVILTTACTAQPTATVAPTATTPAVTLSVSGSGSVTPVLAAIADEFHAANPGILLEVLPGSDTGDAVRGTVEGVLDFAAMSRAAKDEEVEQGIVYVQFGSSVTAIYSHPDVGVSELTGEQLTGILTGAITNWSDVGGEDLAIVVYIRDPEEGNTVDIRETFIGDAAFSEAAQLMNSQSDMQDAVAGVPGAIGYGTWATAMARDAQVVSVTVDGLGVDNAPETMQTEMGIGYLGSNVEAMQPLIDWLLSAEGQAALQAVGVVPVNGAIAKGKWMTWFRNLRLGVKLSLVIVAALVGLVVFIFIALNVRALSLIDEVGQLRIDQEIQVIEHQFGNTELTLKSAATLLSNMSTFIDAVADNSGDRIYPIALTTLASFETDDFMVIGLDGAPLFNLHEEDSLLTSVSVSDMMNQTLFGVEHISLIAEESAPPLVHWVLTRPIRNESGEVIGGLLLAQELDSELLNTINLGRAGVEIGLVYDGQLIAHSQSLDGTTADTGAELNTTELAQIAQAISSDTILKTGTVYLSDGTPAVEAYMPLQAETDLAPNAAVVIWVVNNEIANFRDNAIRTSGVALLGLLGLVVGAMLFQANYLVIRPLEQLRLSAVRFGRGDYTQRAVVTAQDEIGQLALTFNAMAENIERLVKVLEREIEVSEEARERAERSDQVKSSFLASMSHELRTPLNSIINFTKFVAKGTVGPVNEEQQQMLDDVIDSARHLLGLINDVLDMSKIESGSLKLFVEDNVDLNAILNAAVNTSRSLLIEKSVTLETAIDNNLPLLRADRQRILQVLLNLLSNACKFTEEGYIMVSASQRGNEVEISIQDTGPGIDDDEQTAVFEAFKQSSSGLRQGGGTGLGLPISRSLAEAHGGRLWFESTVGKGSTFFVRIPVKSETLTPIAAVVEAVK